LATDVIGANYAHIASL